MYNRASDTRLETAKAVATAMVADTSLPSSIKSYAVLPKAQMRPLLQHVQQNVPGLLRKYDRVKYTRASTSGRQHSAAVVACRPNAVPTVVASRGVAHGSSVPAQTSAAAVPQRNYTGTAVLPILKDEACRRGPWPWAPGFHEFTQYFAGHMHALAHVNCLSAHSMQLGEAALLINVAMHKIHLALSWQH
ncbi:hypothetical protein WJX77_012462 [Trebouxia sp. C0004]